ncbi:unnamed protein product [Closterium sp. NIES-64]|nr:unnamed protein product [Closterium sp. NIES-64]
MPHSPNISYSLDPLSPMLADCDGIPCPIRTPGKHLAQHCRQEYPSGLNVVLWIIAEINVIASDVPQVVGTAIALNLLFPIPLWAGVLITGCSALLLLALERFGARPLETIMALMVLLIAGCFIAEMVKALQPSDVGELFKGMVVPQLQNVGALAVAISILGATVMPHNLYLHSAIVLSRKHAGTTRAIRTASHYSLLELALALLISVGINVAVISVAGAVCHSASLPPSAAQACANISISNAHVLLTDVLGKWAGTLFGVALLAAGQSSTVTGTYAGQYVMQVRAEQHGHWDVRRAVCGAGGVKQWLQAVCDAGGVKQWLKAVCDAGGVKQWLQAVCDAGGVKQWLQAVCDAGGVKQWLQAVCDAGGVKQWLQAVCDAGGVKQWLQAVCDAGGVKQWLQAVCDAGGVKQWLQAVCDAGGVKQWLQAVCDAAFLSTPPPSLPLSHPSSLQGFIELRISTWLRNLITRLIAIVPALLVALLFGANGASLLIILCSIVSSFGLPFALIPLLKFTSTTLKMGMFATHAWTSPCTPIRHTTLNPLLSLYSSNSSLFHFFAHLPSLYLSPSHFQH